MAHLSVNPRSSPLLPLRPRLETTPTKKTLSLNVNTLPILKRPWRRIKKHDGPEPVFVTVRRNWKVCASIRFSRRTSKRFVTILNTVSGPSFIRKDALHGTTWNKIKPTVDNFRISDDNNRSVHLYGTIDLVVYIVRAFRRSVSTLSND